MTTDGPVGGYRFGDTSVPAGTCPSGNWSTVVTDVDFSYTYTITFLSNPPNTFFSTSG